MAVSGFRHFGAMLLATALACQTSVANAVCVTESEARSVALFAAPDVLRALSNTCRGSVPANAYLIRSSDALTARYRAVSASAWPGVQALLGRVPEARMFASLDENAARGMIGALLQDKAFGKISPVDCGIATQMLEALDPLPPQNMANFLVALVRLGEAAGRRSSVRNPGNKGSIKPSLFCGAAPVPKSVTVTVPSK